MSTDSVVRTVKDWSRPHIGFRHPEGAFDVVELVVKTNDISTGQLLLGKTGDVAFPTG
ncbi:hypothetical protein [Corynebacterium diphtheriae]|uniref:hypothetical protein n=1 Tax=Corynebacterium diphtheriae TaxID=1717 RepID=UPI0012FF9086|nr:hypothetical protein [Corynebacterium diphtheriae]